MNVKRVLITIFIFIVCAGGIALLAYWPFNPKTSHEQRRTRVIIPGTSDGNYTGSDWEENIAFEESYSLKVPPGEGEMVITVLNNDFDYDSIEEQVVVYRNSSEPGSPVSIAYYSFDERSRSYKRQWNSATAATMPGTVSIFTQDLLGDRSPCIIVTGMNSSGEHTITIFHRETGEDRNLPFSKIAEIQIDGSITLQEPERSLAYRQGITSGQAFTIAAYGRDTESENLLDRIEILYNFSPVSGNYEQSRITRIPGSQIEQRRLREILSGDPKVFENFINDLWYYVSPGGTLDKSQYLYFDPEKREIIFFGNETQQVFVWQHSNSTRLGLYISSQNISVVTLRRFLDIELETLDSIRMTVFEDVKLKIRVSADWDGYYRRAGTALKISTDENTVHPYREAVYDSSMGRLRFNLSGDYELVSSGSLTNGRYAFFRVGNQELLELRPFQNVIPAKTGIAENRYVYSIAAAGNSENTDIFTAENLSLSRVRLGASGIHDLHEGQIILTRAR